MFVKANWRKNPEEFKKRDLFVSDLYCKMSWFQELDRAEEKMFYVLLDDLGSANSKFALDALIYSDGDAYLSGLIKASLKLDNAFQEHFYKEALRAEGQVVHMHLRKRLKGLSSHERMFFSCAPSYVLHRLKRVDICVFCATSQTVIYNKGRIEELNHEFKGKVSFQHVRMIVSHGCSAAEKGFPMPSLKLDLDETPKTSVTHFRHCFSVEHWSMELSDLNDQAICENVAQIKAESLDRKILYKGSDSKWLNPMIMG